MALRRPAVIAAPIVAVAAPIDTMALASNKQVVLIERGEVGKANAQWREKRRAPVGTLLFRTPATLQG